jgi:hypothetical protein
MAIDIKAALAKSGNATKFANAFLADYLTPAFGSRSKYEVDLLVFSSLIEAGVINPKEPAYDIARALNITPTRVRTLILNWQLRSTPPQHDFRREIVATLKKTRFSADGKLLTFGVEEPLLREEIAARLKRKGFFPDASFSKELVKLPVEAFVEFLDEIVDDATKKQVRDTLVKDKQLPNTSFKALARDLLVNLGRKAAGEAGGAFVGEITDKVAKPATGKVIAFLTELISGDASKAARGITKDDLSV